jgi:hypothetical protein
MHPSIHWPTRFVYIVNSDLLIWILQRFSLLYLFVCGGLLSWSFRRLGEVDQCIIYHCGKSQWSKNFMFADPSNQDMQ